ncbi:MAG TPA: hypothetical protein VM848_04780 [Acidimicrobiia bacterium]|nr:hypothetical protein [Acidimicrobiia bacterium]
MVGQTAGQVIALCVDPGAFRQKFEYRIDYLDCLFKLIARRLQEPTGRQFLASNSVLFLFQEIQRDGLGIVGVKQPAPLDVEVSQSLLLDLGFIAPECLGLMNVIEHQVPEL